MARLARPCEMGKLGYSARVPLRRTAGPVDRAAQGERRMRRWDRQRLGFWFAILGGLALVVTVLGIGLQASGTTSQAHPGAVLRPAPAPSSARFGYDPLSGAERSTALQLAQADARVAEILSKGTRSEVLVVERHEEDKAVYAGGSWDRRADVVAYAYGSDVAVRVVVNLTQARVDAVSARQGDQPPFNAVETDAAFARALADTNTGPLIRTAYAKRAGTALRDAANVQRYAFVFVPDEVPEATSSEARACGISRCALLILAVQGGVLDTAIVVDLSHDRVVYDGGQH